MFGVIVAHQEPSYRRLNKSGICREQGLIPVGVSFFDHSVQQLLIRGSVFPSDSIIENAFNLPYHVSNVKISDLIFFRRCLHSFFSLSCRPLRPLTTDNDHDHSGLVMVITAVNLCLVLLSLAAHTFSSYRRK